MSRRTDAELLGDILGAARRVTTYVGGMSYAAFVEDTKTQDAVIRNIEIIGEAAKNVSDAARARCPQVPWRQMAGSRDRLIHDYSGVNLDIVRGPTRSLARCLYRKTIDPAARQSLEARCPA